VARYQLASVASWITAACIQHPHDLPAHVMQRLSIPRSAANGLLKKLVAGQWLVNQGTPRKPLYVPGALRQVVQQYALNGLLEDLPWRRDFAPYLALPTEVRRMAQHAFTELVNNAVDHSGGTTVTVSIRQTPLHLQLLVSDDGCGLFNRIAQSFDITDPTLALFEISKGKLTSAPDRHSGHGLFYSSRLADVLDLHANSAAFQYRGWGGRSWHATRSAPHTGTSIYMAIALDTTRTLDEVLRGQSDGGYSYTFERTRVPLRLLSVDDALASRADAKRVAARLTQFGTAEIDFTGVERVGHSFADELFRVFSRDNPQLQLVPLGMNPQVAQMVQGLAA